jgi:hypothetical protein
MINEGLSNVMISSESFSPVRWVTLRIRLSLSPQGSLCGGPNSSLIWAFLPNAISQVCHKAKSWSYEREWRIVFPYSKPPGENNHFIPIKSITFGLEADRKV